MEYQPQISTKLDWNESFARAAGCLPRSAIAQLSAIYRWASREHSGRGRPGLTCRAVSYAGGRGIFLEQN